jgi:hypothetical protein
MPMMPESHLHNIQWSFPPPNESSSQKINHLLPFKKTITVYSDNHKEHINTLGEQNTSPLLLKQVVHTVTTVF